MASDRHDTLAKGLWQDLLDKDDRTSPEEYPDMALITFDELRDTIAALRPVTGQGEAGWVKTLRRAANSTPDHLIDVVLDRPVPTDAVEADAWEAYWPGAGSIDSVTRITRFRHQMEDWRKDGAEITPLYASRPAALSAPNSGAAGLTHRHKK